MLRSLVGSEMCIRDRYGTTLMTMASSTYWRGLQQYSLAESGAGVPSDGAYKVGAVMGCQPVPGRGHCMEVDVGDCLVTVLTNSFEGTPEEVMEYIGTRRVVVEVVGRDVAAASDPQVENEQQRVIVEQPACVATNRQQGVLCDHAMLGWVFYPTWRPVLLPSHFVLGAAPPETMPKPHQFPNKPLGKWDGHYSPN
eukprot:TRINITY_DN3884_c0_g1_i1.p1 TRINITY_DN3884_c0_g1~~TRINITY_DN3884_c0_g1_i1.p1  ORF type:complete len:196 (-),score=45.13 TRINITY_DN3884_c0_g1_i1:319-906(-)